MHYLEIEEKYKDKPRHFRKECPACNNKGFNYGFKKYEFHYVVCSNCSSLYLLDPIKENEHTKYSSDVEKSIYKSEEYKDYMSGVIEKLSFDIEIALNRFIDSKVPLNIGYYGSKNQYLFQLIGKRNTKYVYNEIKIDINEKHDVIILNNIIESQIEPSTLLHKIHSKLNRGGIIYVTARLGSGIDIMTLWNNAFILPLQHVNLFSIEGIKELFKPSFEILEISTPGSLDIQNIADFNASDIPRIFTYMLQHRGSSTLEEFQTFIQKNLLSSYLVMIARRGG